MGGFGEDRPLGSDRIPPARPPPFVARRVGVPPLIVTGPGEDAKAWEGEIREVAREFTTLKAPNVVVRSRSSLARIGAPQALGSAFVDGWTRADDLARALRDLIRTIQSSAQAEDLAAAMALDYLPKAVLENGAAPGWYVPERVVLSPFPVRQRLDPGVCDELAACAASVDPAVVLDFPEGTNHGWPDCSTSLESLDAHVGLAAVTRAEGPAEAAALAKAASLTEVDPFSMLWRRSGPRARPMPYWALQAQGLIQLGSAVGAFPFSRPVYGVPAWLNLAMLPEGEVATQRLKRGAPQVFRHVRTAVSAWRQTYRAGYWRAQDDLRRYDQTQGLPLQDDVADLIGRISGSPTIAEIIKYATRLPVAYPPLGGVEGITVVPKLSGLASGLRITSLAGSIVNFDRVCQCFGALFNEPASLWARRFLLGYDEVTGESFLLSVQGDDTAWEIPERYRVSDERWVEINLRRGFEAKPLPGFVFLATGYSDTGEYFGASGRAAGRTGYRESPARSLEQELVGAYSRWLRCRDDPWAPVCWNTVVRPRLRYWGLGDMTLGGFLDFGARHFKLWAASLQPRELLDEATALGSQLEYAALREILLELGASPPETDARRIVIHLSALSNPTKGRQTATKFYETERIRMNR